MARQATLRSASNPPLSQTESTESSRVRGVKLCGECREQGEKSIQFLLETTACADLDIFLQGPALPSGSGFKGLKDKEGRLEWRGLLIQACKHGRTLSLPMALMAGRTG